MNLEPHLRVAGALQLALAAANIPLSKWLHWRTELPRLSPVNRQVVIVHSMFIVLTLALFGLLSLLAAPDLLAPTRLAALTCAGLALFWLARLLAQFFVYSPTLWRGHPGRTAIHIALAILWTYLATVYALALAAHACVKPPITLQVMSAPYQFM